MFQLFRKYSTTPTITDPLVVYKSYVARGLLKRDQSQLRAAIELQKLYYRVKDYRPKDQMQQRIREIVKELELKELTRSYNENNRKPLLHWFKPSSKPDDSLQDIVKVLDNEEELLNFESPHGIILTGEVGCGKSMLTDIFANSLPHTSKFRWHYSTFMLWVFNQIHLISTRRQQTLNFTSHSMLQLENELILFEIAQRLVKKNTVLILDEFMMPDLAAAKIIKMLFVYFFKLGGVLVANSNRMPENLYVSSFKKNEFTSFLNILSLRCYCIDMNSDLDYRKMITETAKSTLVVGDNEAQWNQLLSENLSIDDGTPFRKESITVYGRTVELPKCLNGMVKFSFNELCKEAFGPADFISLSSTYHTFIIDQIPVLTITMKNEARRFITLIDALYECNCKLYLHTKVHPNELFFPDQSTVKQDEQELLSYNRIKVQEEEMYSKTSIASDAPYRPNVSYYDDEKIVYNDDNNGSSKAKSFELLNFNNSDAFTGEDEKFAYKRAVSRIIEMCQAGDSYNSKKWVPVDKSLRTWEVSGSSAKRSEPGESPNSKDLRTDPLTGEPVNNANSSKPVFSTAHFWSMGQWGKGDRITDKFAKKWIRGCDIFH